MPRPKGSKNKPKRGALTVSQIDAQLEKSKAAIEQFAAQQETVLSMIAEQKNSLKDLKKQVAAEKRTIDALQRKREAAVALETAKAQKSEIEAVVAKLVSSGKSAEDILSALNGI